jgi:hypothetical protein
MTMIDNFNIDSLKFLVFDPKFHDLPNLQLKQSNGEDPLNIQSYYEDILKGNSFEPKVVYIIKYGTEIIGFFSVASALIEPTISDFSAQINPNKNSLIHALLVSKIGIDQNYRCFGLGKYILQYCIGLARNLKEKKEFDIVLFRTTKSLAQKIYCLKYNFKIIQEDEKLVWVYKKI